MQREVAMDHWLDTSLIDTYDTNNVGDGLIAHPLAPYVVNGQEPVSPYDDDDTEYGGLPFVEQDFSPIQGTLDYEVLRKLENPGDDVTPNYQDEFPRQDIPSINSLVSENNDPFLGEGLGDEDTVILNVSESCSSLHETFKTGCFGLEGMNASGELSYITASTKGHYSSTQSLPDAATTQEISKELSLLKQYKKLNSGSASLAGRQTNKRKRTYTEPSTSLLDFPDEDMAFEWQWGNDIVPKERKCGPRRTKDVARHHSLPEVSGQVSTPYLQSLQLCDISHSFPDSTALESCNSLPVMRSSASATLSSSQMSQRPFTANCGISPKSQSNSFAFPGDTYSPASSQNCMGTVNTANANTPTRSHQHMVGATATESYLQTALTQSALSYSTSPYVATSSSFSELITSPNSIHTVSEPQPVVSTKINSSADSDFCNAEQLYQYCDEIKTINPNNDFTDAPLLYGNQSNDSRFAISNMAANSSNRVPGFVVQSPSKRNLTSGGTAGLKTQTVPDLLDFKCKTKSTHEMASVFVRSDPNNWMSHNQPNSWHQDNGLHMSGMLPQASPATFVGMTKPQQATCTGTKFHTLLSAPTASREVEAKLKINTQHHPQIQTVHRADQSSSRKSSISSVPPQIKSEISTPTCNPSIPFFHESISHHDNGSESGTTSASRGDARKNHFQPDAKVSGSQESLSPDLMKAANQAILDGKMTPLIKQELKCAILARRHKEGKEDINISLSPKREHEPMSQEEIEKKKRRQELNKVAAAQHRQRKKKHQQSLESEREELEERNAGLKDEVTELEREKQLYVEALGIPPLYLPMILKIE